MMVKMGDADGMVSGACHSTADTLRPSLQILKTAPGTKLVSSFLLMNVPNCEFGNNGTFVFSDCGLNQNPNAEELAAIAKSSADSYRALTGDEPKVAMLSYSTMGSAKHDDVTKVEEATRIAKEENPDLALDGTLQLDAAIVQDYQENKAAVSQKLDQLSDAAAADLEEFDTAMEEEINDVEDTVKGDINAAEAQYEDEQQLGITESKIRSPFQVYAVFIQILFCFFVFDDCLLNKLSAFNRFFHGFRGGFRAERKN